MHRPLVFFAAFYIAGVLIGGFTSLKVSAALALAFICFLTAIAGYVLNWRENRIVLLIFFLLLGLALSRLGIDLGETPLVNYAGRKATLVGMVADEPDVREDKVFYLLQVRELVRGQERQALPGIVRLQVKECSRVFGYGDMLKVSGLLARPEQPGNPGAFDYRKYLERQGIRVVLLARGETSVQRVGTGGGNMVLDAALKVKQRLSMGATESLTDSQAAVINGIVFGSQGLIDRNTRQVFSETGVVHILSVSGLHVGLVLGGLLGLLRLFKASPSMIAPLATPVLIFYALMTGLVPAVLRATIMALLFLWAHHLGRERDWPTTMALAALAILLWNPLQIYNPGFQLSFAATWGILYLGPAFTGYFSLLLKRLPPAVSLGMAQALAVPLAAQLATVPLVAWYYNMVTPVSIMANLLAVPLVGLILLSGIIAALLGLVWLPLAGLVNAGTGALLDLFLALVTLLRKLPGAVFYLATPPVYLAVVWYAALLGAVRASGTRGQVPCPTDTFSRERIKGWALPAVALFLALLLIWWPFSGNHKLTVHFLDVGQGDSILIQAPSGKNMLIDAGGWRDEFQTGRGAGDQVVTPYLRRIGVNRLDALVLTHPHEDHAGGAAAVVKNFPVGTAIVSPVPGKAGDEIPPAYTALLAKMEDAGVPVQYAGTGDILLLDSDLSIEFLSPDIKDVSGLSLNDGSLVIKLTYGRRSFLFTGDVELEAQIWLLRKYVDMTADVLKMPHHGSRFLLPEFVEAVNPRVAVITVGARNTFGHPARSTLDLLGRCGALVYRTDKDGAVIISTDGNRLEVKTGKRDS